MMIFDLWLLKVYDDAMVAVALPIHSRSRFDLFICSSSFLNLLDQI